MFAHTLKKVALTLAPVPPTNAQSSQWQGSLYELSNVMYSIRRSKAFGRLTLRNANRLGVAHLYFRYGKLAHIVGNRGEVLATLNDLKTWSQGTVRFERGGAQVAESLSEEQVQQFDDLLAYWQRRGVLASNKVPTVIEAEAFLANAEQLITPMEWQVLVEGTRRISMAVAHLVGPKEAGTVLRDILDDCTSAFPAFSSLEIAPSGYLQMSTSSNLDHIPRKEVLDGFAALFATSQYFCAPIIGEDEAYKLFAQTLGELRPMLMSLEVFQLNRRYLLG